MSSVTKQNKCQQLQKSKLLTHNYRFALITTADTYGVENLQIAGFSFYQAVLKNLAIYKYITLR